MKRWSKVQVPLAPGTILHGPNGCGKSSILHALQLGILGHVPSVGRATGSVAELSSPGLTVAAELSDNSGWGVRREFTVDDKGGVRQKVHLAGRPARTLDTAEAEIDQRWGRLAVALDLAEFLSSSPDKQAAAIFALSRAGVRSWDPAAFLRAAALEALRVQVGADQAELVIRVADTDGSVAEARAALERASGGPFAQALRALEGELSRLHADGADLQGGILAVQERMRGVAYDARKARVQAEAALAGLASEAAALPGASEGGVADLEASRARNALAALREAMAGAEARRGERKRLETDLQEARGKAGEVPAGRVEALRAARDGARAACRAAEDGIRAARAAREDSVRARKVHAAATLARAGADKALADARERNKEALEVAGRARLGLIAAEETADVRSGEFKARNSEAVAAASRLAQAKADTRAAAVPPEGGCCPTCRQAIPEAHRAALSVEAAKRKADETKAEVVSADAIRALRDAETRMTLADTLAREALRQRNAAELEVAASGEALQYSASPADPGLEPALTPEPPAGIDPATLEAERVADAELHAIEGRAAAAEQVRALEARLAGLPPVDGPAPEEVRAAEAEAEQADARARAGAEAAGLRDGIERRRRAAEDARDTADAAIAMGQGVARERDRILAETLGPVRDAIQAAMPASLLRGRQVYVGLLPGPGGRPYLDMGLDGKAGRATMRTLSGGERAAFCAGLAAAILGRAEVPLRVLILEAAELDAEALRGVVGTLDAFLSDGRLSNAVLATCGAPALGADLARWAAVKVEELDG